MNDLRYAWRALVQMRGVAGVAIATLAVGIAATTIMFTATYAALLRPVPFDDPDRLVLLFTTHTTPREGLVLSRWSRPLIDRLVASVKSYESLASYSPSLVALATDVGDPEQIDSEVVSPGYFETLRVRPALGRTFTSAEDAVPGEPALTVLSDALWRTRCAADPTVIGKAIRVNGVVMTVIGVMPAGFAGLSDKARLWIPRTMAPRLTYAEYLTTPQRFIPVVARLKPGVTLERANAELSAAAAAFDDADGTEQWGAIAQRVGDARVDPMLRRSVLLLLGAAACVLVMTCTNVAGVLVARGRLRRREIAVRLALGARRVQIVRQLLTESVMLAAAAGTCGTALAAWGVQLFVRYVPAAPWTGRTAVASFSVPSLDLHALFFAVGVTLATTVLCGWAPVLDSARTTPIQGLREDDRSGGAPHRVFRCLVVVEVGAAAMLLATAGLLLDGFGQVQRLRTGFTSEGVLTFWVRPPVSRYPVTDGPATVEHLLNSVQQAHGVDAAAVNRCTPFTGCSRTNVFFADRPTDARSPPMVGRHYVSADYFKALGIPLLAGRVLTSEDRAGRPPVTVISESAARRFWPGRNPIGRRVWFGGTTGPFANPAHAVEVVGVVGDVKYEAVDWPGSVGRPEFYTSYLQFCYPDTMVIVKARIAPAALLPELRRAVRSVDPALPIYDVLTLDDRVADAVARPRFTASLVTGCAVAALLIAALGVYGILAYSVSSRVRELGVRMAVGAAPGQMLWFVLADGLRLAGVGLVMGLGGALAATRLAQRVVLDLRPSSPVVLAGVMLTILAVAAAAAFLPARRASLLDPAIVLRED